MRVYFIGAGPGDPDLITVKGKKILERADVVVYAGSLINPQLLECCRPGCELYDSALLSLEEIVAIYKKMAESDKVVVRLHSGEPSLYGAIKEQIDWLIEQGIGYEIVPGVSSFAASAAALSTELTLPGISQTVVITRMAGRIPVPKGQEISSLAEHKPTMCVFLSVQMIDKLVDELRKGYPGNTSIAVVERASWPDERIIRGTLADIAEKVKAAGVVRTAMIVVGRVLDGKYDRSKLYNPQFSHGYREGST
ncbi:MAG: precorrin-4 C(11)-methyltransferase [Actinobacteria bacterium]|nr:precorrin-4 C(11)-methyltransferase [Actinomycetota bacterium]